jgi:hypothetical protein
LAIFEIIDPPPDDYPDPAVPGTVPFGNFFLIIIGVSVVCLILLKKRQIVRESK